MRSKNVRTLKSLLALAVVAVMVMLSVLIIPPTVAHAASKPVLTKTTLNIIEGNSYDINIKNKITGSTYTWTSSNKKVATVNKVGLVKGIKKGEATITCTVKAPKKTYTLTCKVSVLEEASDFFINNKVTVLNLGQVYDLNRTLIPATSNEKTKWTSSNKKIANPDKNGKFTALKTGTVTITATTTSGLKDSVTIKVVDKAGIVTNQKELEALLGTGVGTITIKTLAEVSLTIPKGDYKTTKLVVDAPNADITNKGVFKSIDIKSIKSSTWLEEAIGNLLNILASNARVIIADGAGASISIQGDATKVTIENNGYVEEIVIDNAASIVITGTSKELIPVIANVLNANITSDIPLDVTSNQKITLVLLSGAEGTKVTAANEAAKPVIQGSITVVIIVDGTPSANNPAPSTGGGYPGGGSGSDYVNGVKVTRYSTYTDYELEQPYNNLASVVVRYVHGTTTDAYVIEGSLLSLLNGYLGDPSTTLGLWKAIDGDKFPVSIAGVKITGVAGSATKTVEFTGTGPASGLSGRSYEVTVNYPDSHSVTVKSNQSGLSYTLTKVGTKTLSVTGSHNLTFEATFK